MLKSLPPLPHILAASFLAAGFALSIFFRGTDSFLFAPTIISVLLFAFFAAVYPGLRKELSIPWTGTSLSVLLYGLYMTASPLWSSVVYNSVLFSLIINVLPFLFLALITLPQPEKQVKLCVVAFGAVLVVLAGWALIQFFFFFDIYGPRIHHPMLNPNSIAALFCLGLIPALGLFVQAKDGKVRAAGFALFLLFCLALLVTQSRGAMLAAGGSSLLLLFITRRALFKDWWKLPVILASCLGLFILVDVFSNQLLGRMASQLGDIGNMHSALGRLALWGATWQLITDHFWGGTGLGTFYYYYAGYRMPADDSDGYFAHMDPLQFWAETGIAAPILFYAVLVAILMRTQKALKAVAPDSALRMKIMAPFCALLAVTLHTHITFHLYILTTAFALAFPLAYWYVATEKALEKDTGGGERKVFSLDGGALSAGALTLAALVLIAVGGWLVRAGLATSYITKANVHFSVDEIEQGAELVRKAHIWAPGSYARAYEFDGRLSLVRLQGAKDSSKEAQLTIYQGGIANFDEADARSPVFMYSKNYRALLLYQAYKMGVDPGGKDKAIEVLKGVLAFNPLFLDARIGLGRIYEDQGQMREALALLENGLIWPKPKNVKTVHYLMQTANLRKKLGDPKGHAELYLQAKNINDILRRHMASGKR